MAVACTSLSAKEEHDRHSYSVIVCHFRADDTSNTPHSTHTRGKIIIEHRSTLPSPCGSYFAIIATAGTVIIVVSRTASTADKYSWRLLRGFERKRYERPRCPSPSHTIVQLYSETYPRCPSRERQHDHGTCCVAKGGRHVHATWICRRTHSEVQSRW